MPASSARCVTGLTTFVRLPPGPTAGVSRRDASSRVTRDGWSRTVSGRAPAERMRHRRCQMGSTAAASRSVRSWLASQSSYTERTMATWPGVEPPAGGGRRAPRAATRRPRWPLRAARGWSASVAWHRRVGGQADHPGRPALHLGEVPLRGALGGRTPHDRNHRHDPEAAARHPGRAMTYTTRVAPAGVCRSWQGRGIMAPMTRGAPGAAGSPVDDPHLLGALHAPRPATSCTGPTWPRARPACRSPSTSPPRPATTPTTSSPAARSARSACRWRTSGT